jgi:hypothetical protein
MPTGSFYFRGTGDMTVTVDTYSGSYALTQQQLYGQGFLDTFPLTPVPNFQARVAANNGSYEALSCQNTVLADIGTRILSSASLLVTPNGYTEGVLFSTLPNSSSGDFTVTRATTATRVNAAGLVELVPYNLLQYSEQFNQGIWSVNSISIVTNDATAPNGTLTAEKIRVISGQIVGSSHIQQSVNKSSGQLQFSCSSYLKAAELNSGRLFVRDSISSANNANAQFNLSTGVISIAATANGTFSSASATITNVGNGWYRCTLSFTSSTDTVLQFRIGTADTTITTGNGIDGIFVWGAQLVEGTDPLPYQPTTTRLNISRADYSLGGCPNILLEPQRTNSIRNSTMVGAVAGTPGTLPTNWSNFLSGLTQTIVGVGSEGGVNYIDFRFNGTATGISLLVFFDTAASIPASNGQSWTLSNYIKLVSAPSGASSYNLLMYERAISGAYIGEGSTAISPTSTLSRFTLTRTLVSGVTVAFVQPMIRANLSIGTAYDFTIRIAAPQMELGAYATSYIPTTSATVTRNADVISRSNIFTNGLLTSSGGTWFVDLRNNLVYTRDGASNGLYLTDATLVSFGFRIKTFGTARVLIYKVISGIETAIYLTTTDISKIAIKWNGTTADVFVNGVKVVAATAFTDTAMQVIASNVSTPININSMGLAPIPLSDSQCIELTGGGYDTPELAYASLGLTSESPLYLNQSVNSLIF